MLVLSRREKEKIVFPDIGVSIELLQIKGSRARIGVDAPAELEILRGELIDDTRQFTTEVSRGKFDSPRQTADVLRKRMQLAARNLQLFRKQLEHGLVIEAEATFRGVLEQLQTAGEGRDRGGGTTPELTADQNERTEPTALVVEDDQCQAELLASYLRLHGFHVEKAGDGANALDYLSHHKQPDVVLMDMIMPNCDGPTAVQEIRRNPEYDNLTIIAVSGTSPSDLGVKTGREGIDRWFPKPVNPKALVDHLTSVLPELPRTV